MKIGRSECGSSDQPYSGSGLLQVNEAAEVIYDLVDPNANLIFGAVVDSSLGQEVSITLIATGFGAGAFVDSSVASYLERGPKPAPVAPPADMWAPTFILAYAVADQSFELK